MNAYWMFTCTLPPHTHTSTTDDKQGTCHFDHNAVNRLAARPASSRDMFGCSSSDSGMIHTPQTSRAPATDCVYLADAVHPQTPVGWYACPYFKTNTATNQLHTIALQRTRRCWVILRNRYWQASIASLKIFTWRGLPSTRSGVATVSVWCVLRQWTSGSAASSLGWVICIAMEKLTRIQHFPSGCHSASIEQRSSK